ncbi:MAG: lipopolysaccharide biosynthesis protein [Clostridium sp.]|uniref:lipopolysaccharide biosynthesis protein n=1 Tax=Clostridium sp. TaxID=1506 RepID=UPI00399B8DD7
MRTKNSIKNIYMSILTQIIITLLGFVSRNIFLSSLGTEYLGINGLLTNVLSMLSLVEGGIGTSIIYNLYKPLAEEDEPKIIALVQLYKKLYSILAIIIFVLSMCLYPFLGVLIKGGTNISYLGLVYFIFVIKNVISYLNAHKWSLINADQKGYILVKYNLIFNVLTTISKIIVLKATQSYILYLLIELLIFIIQNIWNGKVVNERYPYIKRNRRYKVDNETRENLITNVKAIFLHNVGTYCVFGTDNLLISSLISLKTVGLYSNYTLIISQLSSLLTPVLNGIGASVGNLIATETKEKSYEIFNVTYFINFWIYSICTITLYNLIEPFIDWAFGKNLLLNKLSLILILCNFYLTGLRTSINIFKSKAGIFSPDKYVPLLEATINLVASLILTRYLGLAGIFLGTTISTISIPIWTQSKLVYNKIFDKSVFEYFKKYFIYLILTLICALITIELCSLIVITNEFISLVVKGIVCVVIPSIIYLVVFFNTKELKYIISICQPIIKKVALNYK